MASRSNTTTTLSDLSIQWEWEGDKGVWQQYPLDIQQEISQAFDTGNKEVNNDYYILLKNNVRFLRLLLIKLKRYV